MTGVGRNTNREFTGCDILSPLEELCPQSLGRGLRCGYRWSFFIALGSDCYDVTPSDTYSVQAPFGGVTLSKPEIAIRLQKWSIELGEYDIHYRPRVSIKGHILVDFIVERPEDDSPAAPIEVEEELQDLWTLFMDGSSCVDGSRAGLILTNPKGTEFTYALRVKFSATNNEADQRALHSQGTRYDSIPRESNNAHRQFQEVLNKASAQEKNKKADTLSKIVSTSFAHLTKQVLVKVLKEKYINEVEVLTVMEEEGNTWMTPIYKYLTEETLNAEKKKARKVRLKSRWFGLPGEIISDNRKQFRDNPFKDWCEKLNIRQRFASVKHPQANGLVEKANKSLGEGMKARLDKGSKD
ncbi:reverse transcriptase domain-containing protein [Tanacetum coccineum]